MCSYSQFPLFQVLGAIIASAIVLGLTASAKRDDALLGANVYDDAAATTTGNTKTRAFGGTPLCFLYLVLFAKA